MLLKFLILKRVILKCVKNFVDCYGVASNKPTFGPYIRSQCTLEIITL